MTIQEAIKSGKPFRRKGWTVWFLMKLDGTLLGVGCWQEYFLTKEDHLADDWEVKA
jgi:hypothetical protein